MTSRYDTHNLRSRSPYFVMLASVLIAMGLLAPAARADLTFGPAGSAAGQTSSPAALAVDDSTGAPSSGDIYVADTGNYRIDVFDSSGAFLRAFGWNVVPESAPGDSVADALEVCTTTCQAGIAGGGAGGFSGARGVAVDNDPASPTFHDVYVADGSRVQLFDPSGTFVRLSGAGVITAGAAGSGDLSAGQSTIANVKTTSRRFAVGQRISAANGQIPPNTTIAALGDGTITLSAPASASATSVAISVAAGAGNVATNEIQTLPAVSSHSFYYNGRICFSTPDPSPSNDCIAPVSSGAPASGPGSVQAALEGLSNINPGDVSVSGPNDGPYTITFSGRYADTDVGQFFGNGNNSTEFDVVTSQNGHSAAQICTAVQAAECSAGVKGFGPGQLYDNVQLAAGTSGALYLGDRSGNTRSGDPQPFNQGRLQTFDSTGAFAAQPLAPASTLDPRALASDAAGDFYVSDGGIKKYDPTGACLAFCASPLSPSFNIRGLALERSTGRILVADDSNVSNAGSGAINIYDSSGILLAVAYGDTMGRLTALTARSAGSLYAINETARDIVSLQAPPPGPISLPPIATAADPIGSTSATLGTYINPEGNGGVSFHFEYITAADYAANGNSFSGPHPATRTTETSVGASDFFPHAFSSQIGCASPTDPPPCLAPNTAYRFRVLATDGSHTNPGAAVSFTTAPPFDFGDAYSTDVGTASATLSAELNPRGLLATGYFEYVDDATYQQDKASGDGFQHATRLPDVPNQPPLDFGDAADQLVTRSVSLTGLDPDTAYHFRLTASDPLTSLPGPEATFHTFGPLAPNTDCAPNNEFRTGSSSALPDCRAYEQVSPADKGGLDLGGRGTVTDRRLLAADNGSPAQIRLATPEGSALTYSAPGSFADPQAAPWASQYLARRDAANGWENANITPPGGSAGFYGNGGAAPMEDLRFQAFSDDLCAGFLIQTSDIALAAGDQPGFADLYRRDNCVHPAVYETLTTAAPQNRPAGAKDGYRIRVQGFSADGSRAVFRANGRLATSGVAASTATDAEGGIPQLYLNPGSGPLRLVSVMPDGSASSLGSSLGSFRSGAYSQYSDTLARAVSPDAGRIFWTTGRLFEAAKLYLRLNADRAQSAIGSGGHCTEAARACTLAVSESVAPEPAVFWTATPDASEALFSFASSDQESDSPHTGDLYSYDIATQTPTLIAAGMRGVLGASEDLSRIYLTSTEVLTASPNPEGQSATAGRSNLYLYTEGQGFRYIVDLSSALSPDFLGADDNAYGPNPYKHLARVSPDGDRLALFAPPSLTGADNVDAVSEEQDGQVYLYDASANGGAGTLRCVSCNPTGARPTGREFGATSTLWVASYIPASEYSLHAGRVLSDDGARLFFNSFDALLPTDTNGKRDVYEWEAPGSGDCHATDPDYFAGNGGCLSLISTGQSPDDSEFVDAAADGSDVFLTTRQKLLTTDPDDLLDIYDARIGGGFPAPPPPEAPCDLDAGACEGKGSSPENLHGAGSAAFVGPGDPAPVFAKPCPKGKRRVVRGGKTRCVAGKHSKPKHRKRHKRPTSRRPSR